MQHDNASYCSFCRKSYRDVGPLVEGAGDVYICGECIELCQSIIDQERRRRNPPRPVEPAFLREKLDRLVSGQDEAKQGLVQAAGARSEGRGRVLLIGPSCSAQIVLARALAHTLQVPFAAGDAGGLLSRKHESGDIIPLLFNLLRAGDFDVEAAQQGVVFVDGADRPEAQRVLLRLWQDNICRPVTTLQLAVGNILFVCGGSFVGLDEAIARLGRHSEQPVTIEGLTAAGAQPDWANCLAAIARVPPLDEANLRRLVHWVDFHRCEAVPGEPLNGLGG
jgi:ATP-dependent Clp protease ATP-binding subunit ClpX